MGSRVLSKSGDVTPSVCIELTWNRHSHAERIPRGVGRADSGSWRSSFQCSRWNAFYLVEILAVPCVGPQSFSHLLHAGYKLTELRSSWYGTDWTPPENDASKYRNAESRWEETPRGQVEPLLFSIRGC